MMVSAVECVRDEKMEHVSSAVDCYRAILLIDSIKRETSGFRNNLIDHGLLIEKS